MTLMTKSQPFIKWVGGKRSLINEIFKLLPKEFNNYFEPFVGGGAVFFSLEENIEKAILSDKNSDLIMTYKAIKEKPKKLIDKLKEYAINHNEDFYYSIRKRKEKELVEIAAKFLYLNKTCYNGLYRVNSSGEFNVPMGDYKNPNIVQEENIISCSKALQKASIKHTCFEKISPQKGDFVYFDPPYHPISDISFTKYTKEDFSILDQERLANFIKKLTNKGVYIMLSNSKSALIETLYPKKLFKYNIVQAPRLVNCKAEKRGNVEEFLITNY